MAGMVQLAADNTDTSSPRVFSHPLVHSVTCFFVGGFSLVETQKLVTDEYILEGLIGLQLSCGSSAFICFIWPHLRFK